MKKLFLMGLKNILKATIILLHIAGFILILGTVGHSEMGGNVTIWQWLSVALVLTIFFIETLEIKE